MLTNQPPRHVRSFWISNIRNALGNPYFILEFVIRSYVLPLLQHSLCLYVIKGKYGAIYSLEWPAR